MPRRTLADLQRAASEGVCPECWRIITCGPDCRKRQFDHAYAVGYHDGANNMERHEDAFVVEMMEAGEYESGGGDF